MTYLETLLKETAHNMRILFIFIFLFLLNVSSHAANLTTGYVPVVAQGGNAPQIQNGSIYDTGTTNGSGDVGIANETPVETLDITGSLRAYTIYENIPQQITTGAKTYACWNAQGQLISSSSAC